MPACIHPRLAGLVAALTALTMLVSGCTEAAPEPGPPAYGIAQDGQKPHRLKATELGGCAVKKTRDCTKTKMEATAASATSLVSEYFASISREPSPTAIWIPSGSWVSNGCKPNTDPRYKTEDNRLSYCSRDHVVYAGQEFMWVAYTYGYQLVTVVIAHEWAHGLQIRSEVAPLELQADCLAGAVLAYAYRKGLLKQGEDVYGQTLRMTTAIRGGSTKPDIHGTPAERVDWMKQGFKKGAKHCSGAFGDHQRLRLK